MCIDELCDHFFQLMVKLSFMMIFVVVWKGVVFFRAFNILWVSKTCISMAAFTILTALNTGYHLNPLQSWWLLMDDESTLIWLMAMGLRWYLMGHHLDQKWPSSLADLPWNSRNSMMPTLSSHNDNLLLCGTDDNKVCIYGNGHTAASQLCIYHIWYIEAHHTGIFMETTNIRVGQNKNKQQQKKRENSILMQFCHVVPG